MTMHSDLRNSSRSIEVIPTGELVNLLSQGGSFPRLPSPRHASFAEERAAVAAELIRRLAEALDLDTASARVCAQQALTIIQTRRQCPSTTGGLAGWQARRVAVFIEDNLADRILVSDLARLVGLSKSHFTSAFTRHFGRPPQAHLIMCRVDRAKHLIGSTGEPLCQIALDCGFSDQAHLTRVFHRIVGLSPHAWRLLQKRIVSETAEAS